MSGSPWGSSLKLCLVAEADLYPRLAPTCEWDTAAAQAVVTAAGGEGAMMISGVREEVERVAYLVD